VDFVAEMLILICRPVHDLGTIAPPVVEPDGKCRFLEMENES
jgi:hypothetical protein